jgi:hypothetical protein
MDGCGTRGPRASDCQHCVTQKEVDHGKKMYSSICLACTARLIQYLFSADHGSCAILDTRNVSLFQGAYARPSQEMKIRKGPVHQLSQASPYSKARRIDLRGLTRFKSLAALPTPLLPRSTTPSSSRLLNPESLFPYTAPRT